MNPPVAVVETLIKAWPKCLTAKETLFGRLPLHLACTEGSRLGIIQAMLQGQAKFCTQCRDRDYMLPIHLACISGQSVSVIELLLQAYPPCVGIKDKRGNTPLMLAKMSKKKNRNSIITAIAFFMNINAAMSGLSKVEKSKIPLNSVQDEALPETSGALLQVQSNPEEEKELTELAKLVIDRAWDDVIERCQNLKYAREATTWMTTTVKLGDGTEEEWRRLPIHEVCRLNPPKAAVVAIIKAVSRLVSKGVNLQENGGTRSRESWYSRSPVHIACSEGASSRVVEALLEHDPKVAQVMDKDGNLPLHLAYLNGADTDVISVVLRAYPEGVFVSNFAGSTPQSLVQKISRPNTVDATKLIQKTLDVALAPVGSIQREINKAKLTVVAIEAEEEEKKGDDGYIDDDEDDGITTRLARAVLNRQWNAVIAYCADIQDGYVDSRDQNRTNWIESLVTVAEDNSENDKNSKKTVTWRRLPIHEVLRCSNVPEPVFEALIETFPDDLCVPDEPFHRLPFALALNSPVELDGNLLLDILERYEDAVAIAEPDDEGRLPVHLATLRSTPRNVLTRIISLDTQALRIQDKYGCTPLHYALWKKTVSDKVFETILLQAYPNAAEVFDSNGWLPLHYACWKGASLKVVQALLDVYPAGAAHANAELWLPVHFAAEFGPPVAVIESLLKCDPYGVAALTKGGSRPLDNARKLPRMHPMRSQVIDALDKTPQDYGAPEEEIIVEEDDDDDANEIESDEPEYAYQSAHELIQVLNERNEKITEENEVSGYGKVVPSPPQKPTYVPTISEDNSDLTTAAHAFFNMTLEPDPVVDEEDKEEEEEEDSESDYDSSEDEDEDDLHEDEDFDPPGKISMFTVLTKLIERGEWDGVIARCKSTPDEAAVWVLGNLNGKSWCSLPLHNVIFSNPSLEIVDAILTAFPAGVLYADNLGQYPLHLACEKKLAAEIIQLMVDFMSDEDEVKSKKNSVGETAYDIAEDVSHPDLEKLKTILC